MSRKVFDKLASAVGIIAVITLLIAGGLLTAGHSYVNSSVRDQLAIPVRPDADHRVLAQLSAKNLSAFWTCCDVQPISWVPPATSACSGLAKYTP